MEVTDFFVKIIIYATLQWVKMMKIFNLTILKRYSLSNLLSLIHLRQLLIFVENYNLCNVAMRENDACFTLQF